MQLQATEVASEPCWERNCTAADASGPSRKMACAASCALCASRLCARSQLLHSGQIGVRQVVRHGVEGEEDALKQLPVHERHCRPPPLVPGALAGDLDTMSFHHRLCWMRLGTLSTRSLLLPMHPGSHESGVQRQLLS